MELEALFKGLAEYGTNVTIMGVMIFVVYKYVIKRSAEREEADRKLFTETIEKLVNEHRSSAKAIQDEISSLKSTCNKKDAA